MRCEIEIGDHTIVTDEPEEYGGSGEAPTPHPLHPAALASCVATTIAMYANRKGWDVGEARVDVEYDPDRSPKKFVVTVHVPAHLSDEQRDRVADIARRCPVHKALDGSLEVEDRCVSA